MVEFSPSVTIVTSLLCALGGLRSGGSRGHPHHLLMGLTRATLKAGTVSVRAFSLWPFAFLLRSFVLLLLLQLVACFFLFLSLVLDFHGRHSRSWCCGWLSLCLPSPYPLACSSGWFMWRRNECAWFDLTWLDLIRLLFVPSLVAQIGFWLCLLLDSCRFLLRACGFLGPHVLLFLGLWPRCRSCSDSVLGVPRSALANLCWRCGWSPPFVPLLHSLHFQLGRLVLSFSSYFLFMR